MLHLFELLKLFFFLLLKRFLLDLGDGNFDLGVLLLAIIGKLLSYCHLFLLELLHTLDTGLLFTSAHLDCLCDHFFLLSRKF